MDEDRVGDLEEVNEMEATFSQPNFDLNETIQACRNGSVIETYFDNISEEDTRESPSNGSSQ